MPSPTPLTITNALLTDTGSSSTDGITNTIAMTGTVQAGAIVVAGAAVKITEGTTVLSTVTTNAQGVWTYTPTGLAQGSHSFVATATATGYTAATATLDVTYLSAAAISVQLEAAVLPGIVATLVNFNTTNGANPVGSLITDANGNLFGTTKGGGTSSKGTVFEIVKTVGGYAITPTVLVSFNTANGSFPSASLFADANGNLFGTTSQGGSGGQGTVFEIVKTVGGYASTPTVLVSFDYSTNGSNSVGSLIADASGNLFGTTSAGGAGGAGTVFEIAKTGGGYASTPTVLISFNTTNGATPSGSLIVDANGNLFGTTYGGGTAGKGTVFEIVKSSGIYASAPTVLVSFNDTNGANPYGSLIADANGNLFGTSSGSGINGSYGTVFEIVKAGGSYASTPTVLVSFNNTNGRAPLGSLSIDANGNLFGTTSAGGTSDAGTIFEIVKSNGIYASAPTVLVSFNNTNGASPQGSVIADANGTLFGMTSGGGAGGAGTVFTITPSTDTSVLTGITAPNMVVTLTEGSTVLGSATADGAGAWSFNPGTLSVGIHTIIATGTDIAGNSVTAARRFNYVLPAPTVTSINRHVGSTALNNASSVSFDVAFSNTVTGVTAAVFSVSATGTVTGTIGTITGSGATYTVTIIGITGTGALTLNQTAAGTVVGSGGAALAGRHTGDQSYAVDITAPVITGVTLDKAAYKLGDTVIATIAADAYDGNGAYTLTAGSAIDGMTLSGWTYNTATTTGTASFVVTSASTEVIAGAVAASLQVTDAAGNTSAAYTTPFFGTTIDTHAPTALALSSASTPIAVNSVVGTLTPTDATTGDMFTYALVTDGTTPANSADNSKFVLSGNTLLVGGTQLSPGTDHVEIQVTDAGGNSFTQAYALTVISATVSSINRVSAALSNASNNSFTVSFSAAVTGVSAANFSLSGTDGTGLIGTPTTSDGGITWTVPVTLVSGDGTLRLDLSPTTGITAVSNGGTLAASRIGDQNYTVDTTAPLITGVTLDKTAYNLGETVTATITTTPHDGNGAYTLAAGSAIDGVTLSGWTYNTATATGTASFVVTRASTEVIAGPVAASLRVTDTAGNSSAAYTTPFASTTIVSHDTHAPTALALSSTAVQSPAGSVVGVLTPTDATVGDSFTYALVTDGTTPANSADNSKFVLSGNTLLVGGTQLSSGTDHVEIQVTDAGGSSFTQAYVITVSPTILRGSLATLVSFNGTNGYYPVGSLFADADGNLFGTTQGSYNSDQGTVFEIVKTAGGYASTPTVLVRFNGTNGYYPVASLIADAKGNLFGTTSYGGTSSYGGPYGDVGLGTVFEIVKTAGGYASTPTVLVSFNGTNGKWPKGSLIADANGNLFGTTAYGGTNGKGTVFEIVKTGDGYASTPTVLVNFDTAATPFGSLIADAAGNLFGTTREGGMTSAGGADDKGTVFEIVKTDSGFASTPTVLVSFYDYVTNGFYPSGSLLIDSNGNLFGTVSSPVVQPNLSAKVFEIVKTGGRYDSTPTVLVSFNTTDGSSANPLGSLIADANGNLFGTTTAGGAFNKGTVFEIVKAGDGYTSTPTVLVSFNNTNGASPKGSLIADANGNLFGTTPYGGTSGYGTVFVIPSGPRVTSIARTASAAAVTNAASVSFTVSFSEAMAGVLASNFSLGGTDGTGVIGTPTSTDGDLTWTVAVTGVSGDGTLWLDPPSPAGIATVAAATPLNAIFSGGDAYIIVNSAPVLTNLDGDTAVFLIGGAASLLDRGTPASITSAGIAAGGTLTASITSVIGAEEALGLKTTPGGITIASTAGVTTISDAGTVIGSYASSAGSAGNPLVIALAVGDTAAQVGDLLHALTFRNSNGAAIAQSRTVNITLTDSLGHVSNTASVTVDEDSSPVLTATGTVGITRGETAAAIDSGITVSAARPHWTGGTLVVQITAHADATYDTLSLPVSNPGGSAIWLNSTTLMAGSVAIGSASAASVAGSGAWTFTLNASATTSNVQALADSVRLAIAANGSLLSRTVTFTITDSFGLVSSVTDQVTVLMAPVTSIALLNSQIAIANAVTNPGAVTISLGSSTIALAGTAITAINLHAGVVLTIIGNGDTLNGGSAQGGFVLQAGSVAFQNLTIANMKAQGGAGTGLGGGGAGLGGGLFVGSDVAGNAGTVTLSNVNFSGNAAVGGAGASTGSNGAGGADNAVSAQGFGTGGRGGFSSSPIGGAGGFGGGGGGGFNAFLNFGAGGAGGFGAGNGGAAVATGLFSSRVGTGGGGLGAGADVFVQEGAGITITGTSSLGLGTVTGGTGDQAGAGLGSGIFVQGTNSVTFAPSVGGTETIAGVIADQAGSGGAATIAVNGAGTLKLTAANTYTGGTSLQAGTLEIATGASVGTGVISFTGASTLRIDAVLTGTTNSFANTVANFGYGDSIDLRGLAFASGATAVLSAGTLLTVTAGSNSEKITLAAPRNSSFTVTNDGTNGSLVTAPCFAAGTRIRTTRGEITVETLVEGDRAITATGTSPIVWIGHRRVACAQHPRPWDVNPVRIAPHAFAPNQPSRDVWLSPDHAVFRDGVLIPIRYLINGATIIQEPRDTVTYFHVELAAHAILLAEGLPAESFLDTGNRGAFANGGGAVMMHPDFALQTWEAEACAPLALDGPAVHAARADLLERAAMLGHAMSDDPDLHLLADGRVIRPDWIGDEIGFVLPEHFAVLRLVSRDFAPAEILPTSDDRRRLGVAVTSLILDGETITPEAGNGWHAAEDGLQWTDGDAIISARTGAVLEVRIAGIGRYWNDASSGREPIYASQTSGTKA